MDANEFVRKWAASTRGERAASQEHFIDLCAVLGEVTPNSDPSGDYYAFEKGARTPSATRTSRTTTRRTSAPAMRAATAVAAR
jgi:hypothetical protein